MPQVRYNNRSVAITPDKSNLSQDSNARGAKPNLKKSVKLNLVALTKEEIDAIRTPAYKYLLP